LHAFETLTLAPIDRRLVEPSLMTAEEIAWFDAYHVRVRDMLDPIVDEQTQPWLRAACQPLTH
jgi:Xaa-Pro aminopeptidase